MKLYFLFRLQVQQKSTHHSDSQAKSFQSSDWLDSEVITEGYERRECFLRTRPESGLR